MNPNPDLTVSDDAERAMVSDLESIDAELGRQKELYLRLAADFDNFRRRTAQETDRRAAAQKDGFIRELLPVIDNLERALASGISISPVQLREGVQMTLQQLYQLLRRHGIEAEESVGQKFDPHRHEAMATRHDPLQPDHTVLETFERAYRRGNEIFRPAKVVVNDVNLPSAETKTGAAFQPVVEPDYPFAEKVKK